MNLCLHFRLSDARCFGATTLSKCGQALIAHPPRVARRQDPAASTRFANANLAHSRPILGFYPSLYPKTGVLLYGWWRCSVKVLEVRGLRGLLPYEVRRENGGCGDATSNVGYRRIRNHGAPMLWRWTRGWLEGSRHATLLYMRLTRFQHGRGRGNVLRENRVGVGRSRRRGRGRYRQGDSPRDDGDLDFAALVVKSPVRRGAVWHGQHRCRAPLRRDPHEVCGQPTQLGSWVRGVHALHRLDCNVSRERHAIEVRHVLRQAISWLRCPCIGRLRRRGRSWCRRNRCRRNRRSGDRCRRDRRRRRWDMRRWDRLRRDRSYAVLAALTTPWLVECRVMALDTDNDIPRVDRVRWQLHSSTAHAASDDHQRWPGDLRLVAAPN